jgi:hypothetical protein
LRIRKKCNQQQCRYRNKKNLFHTIDKNILAGYGLRLLVPSLRPCFTCHPGSFQRSLPAAGSTTCTPSAS